MKILFALIAGVALGIVLKNNKTVYINSSPQLDLSKMSEVELDEILNRGMRRLNWQGIRFH